MSGIHEYQIVVDPSVIDENGHANNVQFVKWMVEAAVSHSDATGCTAATLAAGATWVVRSHHIEYLRPALAADHITVRTWVANFRRAFSVRRYRFVRASDGVVLARAETDWAFIDAPTGRPRSVPESIQQLFPVLGDEPQG